MIQRDHDDRSLEAGAGPVQPSNPNPGEEALPRLPAILGDFRILREIGRGGMGVVYEAEQISLRRRVALKVLPYAAFLEPRQLERFQTEAQAAARLHHTHIVPVYAVGSHYGIHYYAMQYIEGWTLTELINDVRERKSLAPTEQSFSTVPAEDWSPRMRDGAADQRSADKPSPAPSTEQGQARYKKPSTDVLATFGPWRKGHLLRGEEYFRGVARLGVQVAEALDHAHESGITHRDIKPSNLILDTEGNVWVTDFGLAQIETAGATLTGEIMGSIGYMSPEQACGDRRLLDHRTDIYSLGVTLYEMLTLQPAFPVADRHQAMRLVCETTPLPPRRLNRNIPRDLETIILKAIEREPQERYATAQELADDLRRFLEHQPIRAARPNVANRIAKWRRRHWALVNAAAVGLVLVTVGLAIAALLINLERGKAVRNLELAEKAIARQSELRDRADELRRQAEDNAHWAEQLLYAADMRLSSQALREHDLRQYNELLQRHVPKPGMADMRGFEWHYLWRRGHATYRDLPLHGDYVHCVRFSPQGDLTASAGRDGVLRVCDSARGEELAAWNAGQGRITGIAFAPDGATLASAGADGTVRIWDWKERRERLSIKAHPPDGYSYRVAFALDGRLLASCGSGSVVYLWDAASGEPRGELRGHEHEIYGLDVSPDGRTLASASRDSTARLWNVEERKEQKVLAGHDGRLTSVAFSPDGRLLATGGIDHRAMVWDVETGERLFSAVHLDGVQAVAITPDSKWLATGDRNEAIRLWGLPDAGVVTGDATEPAAIWSAHRGRVTSIAFAPGGDRLLSGGQDGRVRLWSSLREQPRWLLDLADATANDIAFTPDSRYLWAASSRGAMRWDLAAGRLEAKVVDPRECQSLAIAPQGKLLALAEPAGAIHLCALRPEIECAGRIERGEAQINRCVFSPDSAVLAAADWTNDRLWLFEVASGEAAAEFPAEQCHDVVFSRDGRRLAVDSLDNIVTWSLAGRRRQSILRGHISTVNDLALSPDGRLLASASNDRQVKIWDFASGAEVFSLSGHREYVQAVAFSPDGRSLVSGDRSGSLRVWHVATGSPLGELETTPAPVSRVVFSADGRHLACALEGNRILLLDVAPEIASP